MMNLMKLGISNNPKEPRNASNYIRNPMDTNEDNAHGSFHSEADESLADDYHNDTTTFKNVSRSENSVNSYDDLKGSVGTGSCNKNENDPNINNGITSSAETLKEVRQIKVVIVLVLLVSIAGAISVFFYTKYSEQKEFEIQFENDSNKVLGSLLSSMERRFGVLNSLGSYSVSVTEAANETFPFVHVPHFGLHVGRILQLTNAVTTFFTPVVTKTIRKKWENFASSKNENIMIYINETTDYLKTFKDYYGPMPNEYNWTFRDAIYTDYGDIPSNSTQPYFLPTWYIFPLVMRYYALANFDWSAIINPEVLHDMMVNKQASVGRPELIDRPEEGPAAKKVYELWCAYFSDFIPPEENCAEPISFWHYPVVDKMNYIDATTDPFFPKNYDVLAFLHVAIYWKHLVRDILPPNSKGIVIVFEHKQNSDKFTYQIDGPVATFLGSGDLHDRKFNSMEVKRNLFDLDSYRSGKSEYYGVPINVSGNNTYFVSIYPSEVMKDNYATNKPIIFAVSAVGFILFPFLIFLVYDRTMRKQQNEILTTANRSHAIVSSLFPSNVRDQLYPQQMNAALITEKGKATFNLTKTLGPPIAELYPDTTVLFCDVVDFTKWSSVRDPSQVFTLLESMYCAFDTMATQRKVFKVETIGDCYVAVAGLPQPRVDHAAVMARFAHDILRKLKQVTAELGKSLGPGTATLQVRIGLNSGPTTAGVLRGAKGRFQLFGDTVNTAARMESNSLPGKIMCSQKTADALIAAGKEKWITARDSLVDAKGKGMMQCYWVNIKSSVGSASVHSNSSNDIFFDDDDLEAHSVAWTAEILETLLNEVIAQRAQSKGDCSFSFETFNQSLNCPRDEVTETIVIPKQSMQKESSKSQISDVAKLQIQDYVAMIAKMYRPNPFHNFHHATHVVMATQKLLNRVVKPTEGSISTTAFGITSDPLSQFAIVFSALIHDVDHSGVSNAQLVKEGASLAIRFGNKSVAEQNSIVLAWNLLMDPKFTDFRNLIMATESESRRFRQLIVNSVMATDLFDADLKQLRETRWTKVFYTNNSASCNIDEDCNRRATIIIEHIIQASDVSHTMQHWHIYQEWNRRLFNEMYKAYTEGRADKDPSIGWYNGELWFFDNYIIPLAKKLETCGVFGVSCGELLDYARDNRAEWAAKGQEIVAENLRHIQSKLVESDFYHKASSALADV